MAITLHKLPPVLETYFLDEARSMPTAFWSTAGESVGYLGADIRRVTGTGIMAGWALPISCPAGDILAGLVGLQQILDHATQGRWVMVMAPEDDGGKPEAALWSYMQSALGWEIGFVGAVAAGYVRDVDEIQEKLRKEFSVFAHGTSPVEPSRSPVGAVGAPVILNGVTIRTGDLLVGDSDGVVCVPKDEVETVTNSCREVIIDVCNRLQEVREGRGAADVLGLQDLLKGNVEFEE